MPAPTSVPEISVQELARSLERNEPIQVVDIRAPFRVASGRIELAPDGQFHNIVGSQLATVRSSQDLGLDPSLPVAVVCGHGNSSQPATMFLNQLGFQARSVRGGMAAWMLMAIPRELPCPPSLDRLVQFDRIGKGALGYLLVSDSEALIVDPPRDASAYVEAARDASARIVGVADSHCHADYISGGPALARRLRVPYYLHPADAVYPYDGTPGRLAFTALEDGAQLTVGRASLRALHTPGHTEGSLTYVLDDALALTGDFIFVASVGRPDLAGKTDEWTRTLWQSLLAAREWPEALVIYPAHYGTESERNEDRSIGKPLRTVRRENVALRIEAEAEFAAWVRSKTGTFPEVYRRIKAVNVGLIEAEESEAEELEVGKNECALA